MTQFQFAPTKRKLDKIVAEADEVRYMTLDEIRAMPGLLGSVAWKLCSLRGWYGYRDISGRTERKICILVR